MKTGYRIFFIACIAGQFCSCSKFLDRQPLSTATDPTTWKSDGDANASVAACYSLIRSAFNSAITYYAYGDLPTDEFLGDQVFGGDANFLEIMNVNWADPVAYASTNDIRLKLRLYTNFYTAIAQSNRCLYFINTMPLSAFTGNDSATQLARKQQLLGEAYFTRAFNYFYMARVWGDVPLVTTYMPDVSSAPQLPRSPQSQVLTQAVTDLNLAKQYLNWQNPQSPDRVVRADKGAVFALLAHIYAWKGAYDSCNAACDSVINSGVYTPVDRHLYGTIYQGQSSEGIFEISQDLQSESVQLWNSISGMTLATPKIANVAIPYWHLQTVPFYDTTDLRWQHAFTTIDNNGTNYYSCTKYSTIQTINNNSAYQVAENNIIVFRLSDIILLKAEALAARPAPDYGASLNLVDSIRSLAGVAPYSGITGAALLDTVAAERARELFLEGHRYFDLVRLARNTGTSLLPNISIGDLQAGKSYWPLDPSLFLTNSQLRQTPYWADKMAQ